MYIQQQANDCLRLLAVVTGTRSVGGSLLSTFDGRPTFTADLVMIHAGLRRGRNYDTAAFT
jgi:hypothetical protein